MSIRKFISFGKLVALLMLISYSVTAKNTDAATEFQTQRNVTLDKAADTFHKNMLQTQIVHVSIAAEQSVKLVNSGFGILPGSGNEYLLLQPTSKNTLILQDADRCESVSRLLFPHHFFW